MNINTPVGRLIMGHPMVVSQASDPATKKPKVNDKTGAPVMQCFFHLAIPKNAPEWPAFWQAMKQVAIAEAPNYAAQLQACQDPNGLTRDFWNWKIQDGDNPQYAGREGYAGCWILKISTQTGNITKTYYPQQYDTPIPDENLVKRGDYLMANVSLKAHSQGLNPGMYVNPNIAMLCYQGEEIVVGPAAADVFGQVAMPAMPAGAAPVQPGATAAPVPQTVPVPQTQTQAAPPVPQPQTQAAPPVPQPQAAPVPQPQAEIRDAAGYTLQQYLDVGWTRDMIAEDPSKAMLLQGVAPAYDMLNPQG